VSKKKSVDLFGDDQEARPMNEFERLLNSSGVQARGLATGDRFRGEILAVSGQEAFISTGTPTDAVMPFTPGPNGEKPQVGEFKDVIVVRAREGEILVKEAGSRGGAVETDTLEDAFDMEIPVEGLVTEAVKGGFRVKIQNFSAFCPISQIDWRCVNASDYVGKKYEFIITKFENRGRDIVVSRRKILELERAASEGEFQNKAEIGEIYTGNIFRIEKYGAFVRLKDGIEGLIPISELSWSRINHPQEVVNVDQEVKVKLLSVAEDGDRLKVSFSLKQGGEVDDPWASIESAFPVGTQVEGSVEHKEAFGIFVRLGMGVTGLLPRSAWKDSTEAKEYENKRKGDKLKVRIARIDTDNRKLSLALPGEDEDDSWRQHGSVSTSSSTGKTSGFGTLGDLLKGVKPK
jgi:small subunit ribosomal protein S1